MATFRILYVHLAVYIYILCCRISAKLRAEKIGQAQCMYRVHIPTSHFWFSGREEKRGNGKIGWNLRRRKSTNRSRAEDFWMMR